MEASLFPLKYRYTSKSSNSVSFCSLIYKKTFPCYYSNYLMKWLYHKSLRHSPNIKNLRSFQFSHYYKRRSEHFGIVVFPSIISIAPLRYSLRNRILASVAELFKRVLLIHIPPHSLWEYLFALFFATLENHSFKIFATMIDENNILLFSNLY